jgi:hypothetical protein
MAFLSLLRLGACFDDVCCRLVSGCRVDLERQPGASRWRFECSTGALLQNVTRTGQGMSRVKEPGSDIVQRVMNEQVECGGEIYTRKQLFDELIAEGHPHKYVDAFVFGYLKTVHSTEDQADNRKRL